MPSNFISKLFKNTQVPQTSTPPPNGRSSSDERVASPPSSTLSRPHSQTISYPPSYWRWHLIQFHWQCENWCISPFSSNGARPLSMSLLTDLPSNKSAKLHYSSAVSVPKSGIFQIGTSSRLRHVQQVTQHTRLTRRSLDQHVERVPVKLPTGFHSANLPATSFRQLSPASSTGNLKGFVDKHSLRVP
ncbi:hypothetical protein OG21DRAFT_946430 [Imleria badia]|nr:hypothetical protein OG21DRAFT_946430 [Imleria badia]